MLCPFQINNECWCEKALVKFHGIDPVVKPLSGKMVTRDFMDDLANGENEIDWGWDDCALEDLECDIQDITESIFGG